LVQLNMRLDKSRVILPLVALTLADRTLQHLGYDKLLSGEDQIVAQKLLKLSKWVERNERLILDEADAVLDHKYELCYAVGGPSSFSVAPERWLVAQQ
jgi:hypothetical protein